MFNILEAPFMIEMIRTITNMYAHGWDERNGGNVSLLLEEEAIKDYVDLEAVIRTIDIPFDATDLIGKYFLVTGTGKYFKNVQYDPEKNMGLFRIGKDGHTAELLWGYNDGGRFTSELPAHLMSHITRLKVDPDNHVVMHCHPTNLLAMMKRSLHILSGSFQQNASLYSRTESMSFHGCCAEPMRLERLQLRRWRHLVL